MTRYLLDTSIVAFLFRGKHDIGNHLRCVGADQCYVSEVTIAELTYGAYHSTKVEHNLNMLDNFKKMVNVIPFSEAIKEYAKQKDTLVKNGTMIEDFDLLIGCTAVAKKYTMVTDNVKHFSRIKGIKIENWIER